MERRFRRDLEKNRHSHLARPRLRRHLGRRPRRGHLPRPRRSRISQVQPLPPTLRGHVPHRVRHLRRRAGRPPPPLRRRRPLGMAHRGPVQPGHRPRERHARPPLQLLRLRRGRPPRRPGSAGGLRRPLQPRHHPHLRGDTLLGAPAPLRVVSGRAGGAQRHGHRAGGGRVRAAVGGGGAHPGGCDRVRLCGNARRHSRDTGALRHHCRGNYGRDPARGCCRFGTRSVLYILGNIVIGFCIYILPLSISFRQFCAYIL
mmetsp:Transcript_24423/g.55732  ORF Transcript_24423/g.55732 Transcript_24423/m.55732 type:complete len:258 (-) Transcript_24423:347-1120(-)